MPQTGDQLGIALQLFDSATDKFVRASVYDSAGNHLAGSPANCPHHAGGLYKNTGFFMPTGPFVIASFKVFNDAGFTSESVLHGDGIDIFTQDIPLSVILPALFTSEPPIKGLIEQLSNIVGHLEDKDAIAGHLIDNNTPLEGRVELSDTDLKGVIEDESLSGSIEDPPDLEGEVP